MKSKKARKPRTTGQDMCPGCVAFGCDPMSMSPKFRAKVDKRRSAGLCPACGKKPCECKSTMDKKRTVEKKAMLKVGDRVMAVCGEDPDKGVVEVFGCGVYEGEFIPVEAVGVLGRLLRENKRTNPRIRLDNGSVVYGCECWWGPIEKVQKRLAGKKCVEVRIEDKRKEVEG